MPGATDLYRGLAVVALVALLPWITGWWPEGSLFGFPWSAFVMLLAGPVILVILARAADAVGKPDGSSE